MSSIFFKNAKMPSSITRTITSVIKHQKLFVLITGTLLHDKLKSVEKHHGNERARTNPNLVTNHFNCSSEQS